jgi:hypothetical protein
MAAQSYYYLFSIATVFIFSYRTLDTVLFRRGGKDLTGRLLKEGTPEHKHMKERSNERAYRFNKIFLVLSVINLSVALYTILQIEDKAAARNLAIILPVAVILILLSGIYGLRIYFSENK